MLKSATLSRLQTFPASPGARTAVHSTRASLATLPMSAISRRTALKLSGLSLGASVLGALTVSPAAAATQPAATGPRKRTIVVIGAHPDDPETGCGGTMALLAAAGYDVVSVYLTRGEAGIPGTEPGEAARVRTAEALAACATLQVRAEFLGQIDGQCEVTLQRYAEVQRFLEAQKPDVLFTHWPVDTHADHRACSALVYGTWINLGKPCDLFFFEVMSGVQTQIFAPTDYVDISTVLAQKHAACFAHRSQNIESEYPASHGPMEAFRGLEAQCAHAEAFVRHVQSRGKSVI